ncbi:MAG: TIGR02677 family protein [Solirubrobacteraceae bacterium]
MAVQPAYEPSDLAEPRAVDQTGPPAFVETPSAGAAVDRPGGRQRAFGYLDTASAGRYRQLMGVLLANKARFGLRMTPDQIADRLWERFAARYESADALERDLAALKEWGAVDAYQDTSRAASTQEFKRRRFTYDITAAGEIAERAALAVDSIAARIGALERSQLPELLEALIALATETETSEPRAAKLVALFNDVAAKLDRLRAATGDFMRELGAVMVNDQAVELEPFERYKRRVIDHLTGFRADLRRLDPQFAGAIGRVEQAGLDRILAIAASSDKPPVWGLTEEQVTARRAERLADEWRGVRRWFLGGGRERPPWRELDRALGDAIEWIVTAAQRLIERRAHRVDRAAEYRSLALLFDRAPSTADCHALYAAAFSLYQPRHFSAPDPDPEETPGSVSWWNAPPAPVEASLYRPGARPAGPGRISQLPDHSMARHSLAARRARERDELHRAQRRFAHAGRLRLDQLRHLDALEFRHLLSWLGRALDAAADPTGARCAESQDGLVRLELRPPADPGALVEIRTPEGTLAAPNYEIEVVGC